MLLEFFTYEGDGDEMKRRLIDYQDNWWTDVVL